MTYLVFDTETTGIDVFEDRVVQLFAMVMAENGEVLNAWEWVINPGVEVPEGAAEIHGFTTEYLQANGGDATEALTAAWELFFNHEDKVWVAYNLNFDLSILNAEFARYNIESDWGRRVAHSVRMLDPLVVDRAKDKYRKGKRTLEAVAPHYGVEFDPEAAHKADYDVEITGKVALAVVEKYGLPSNEEQALAYARWATHLQEYFRKTDPDATVDGAWPLRVREERE